MSDPTSSLPLAVQKSDSTTPGQMIRQARETMGIHIVALAAALKVPVRKLEALEANRWEELTDMTFTRALASSVARHLKIDPVPVLAGLPTAALAKLNTPAGLGRVENGAASVSLALAPAVPLGRHTWLAGVLLLGAAALYFSPQLEVLLFATNDAPVDVVSMSTNGVSVSVEPATSRVTPTSSTVVEPVASAVPTGLLPQVPQVIAAPHQPDTLPAVDLPQSVFVQRASPDRVLVLAAAVDTWVEVTDSDKRVRIQRVLKQGEEAVFAEGAPFGVVVGNAAGARVTVRGQSLDLTPLAKNNVARFDVK